MNKSKQTELVIFTHGREKVKLRGDFERETVWASQAEIAQVFGVERSVVTKHIRNIFKDKELSENLVCANFAHTADDGKTYQVKYYNLDIIMAVGYRTNSSTAIQFRQWATKTLREHITKGFTINRARIGENYEAFMTVVDSLKKLAPREGSVDTESVLELVRLFADTWFSLDAYDKEALTPMKVTKRSVALTAKALMAGVAVLKSELIDKGEATDNFATERNQNAVEAIVGNVMQSFGRTAVYPSVEEKAAHLLYFIIKNHPFVDGNKRTGAYAFVWYLRKAKVLDTTVLTPAALTALTLLIAESDPTDKEKMTKLVVLLLGGPRR
jgi:hypothetical protein